MSYELEADLERRLLAFCEQRNWLCLKLILASMIGFPDRTVITAQGVVFLELKRAKVGRLSKAQDHWLKKLNAAGGCEAYRVDSLEQIEQIFERHYR